MAGKQEIIAAIAKHLETKLETKEKITQDLIRKVLDAYQAVACDILSKEDKVNLVGFMTMTVSRRKQRFARNPKTGEQVIVPEQNVVVIKAGTELKEAANKSIKK